MEMQLIHQSGSDLVVRDDKLYFRTADTGTYIFYCYDLESVSQISDIEYYTAKFGKLFPGYQKYRFYDVIEFQECLYLCTYYEPHLIQLDCNGNEVMKWEYFTGTYATSVYNISFSRPDSLWVAAPLENCIVEVSLREKRVIYQSPCEGGYGLPGVFSSPEGVEVYGEYVYVSDMGNERVSKVNINTRSIETHLQIDEAVFEYKKIKDVEIVQLNIGIYQVRGN